MKITKMVDRYFRVARKYFPQSDGLPVQIKTKAGSYLAGMEPPDHADQANELKQLLWRIDSEIMGLYKLPPDMERAILDYFVGYQRPGVPFRQTEYYPARFQGANTLAELVSLTADWGTINESRLKLIDREYDGELNKEEAEELDRLQHLGMLRRRLVAPYPLADLDAEIAKLKREGKWIE